MSKVVKARGPRSANWSVWANVPDWKVWEGVALSLDLEPTKINGGFSWKVDGFVAKESEEFHSRLTVATRNVHFLTAAAGPTPSGRLSSPSHPMLDADSAEISAVQFVLWAKKIGWGVPAEFQDIASKATAESFEDQELQTLRSQVAALELRLSEVWQGFDPDSDTYPLELDIAMQAWRAASNDTGAAGTPSKRIASWLTKNYRTDLSDEAITRITRVVNWDKNPGRK